MGERAVPSPVPAVRAPWVVLLVGAITYVEGHGIHLAANAINNAAPGDTAHLWDEVVGHYVWFTGAMAVWAALTLAVAGRDPLPGPFPPILAMLVGVTAATNAGFPQPSELGWLQ
jgi:hypothetical protein